MSSVLFTIGGAVVNALGSSGSNFVSVGSQIMVQKNTKDMI